MSSMMSDKLFRELIGNPGTDSALSFSGTSAALGGGTPTALTGGIVYRLVATQNCHIKAQTSTTSLTATTSTFPIPAWTPTYISFDQSWYIAAIQNDTAGTLVITPMTATSKLP